LTRQARRLSDPPVASVKVLGRLPPRTTPPNPPRTTTGRSPDDCQHTNPSASVGRAARRPGRRGASPQAGPDPGAGPQLLATAKLQRWTPEDVLRTLVAAEIQARDASNAANQLKAAAFPVHKSLEALDVAASSIPGATFAYLATLEWSALGPTSPWPAQRAPASPTP